LRWRDVPKIDAHTHVVLHERPDTDLVLNTPDQMLAVMDEHRVEQAVVLPINYPAYFPLTEERQRDWLPANNDRQADLMRESAGRFVAFADCALTGTYADPQRATAEVDRAVGELGLRGVKIHPSNLGVPADDERLLRVIGLDRVLFGTDYPIHPYEQYYAVLDRMRFTPTEVERIAYANAARLLGAA